MLEPAVTWEPYTDTVLQSLPPICTPGAHIWHAHAPIICMENVEMHVSDRVLRQFGMNQHIPDPVLRLICVNRNKYRPCDWSGEINAYILEWEDRANRIQNQCHTHIFGGVYVLVLGDHSALDYLMC